MTIRVWGVSLEGLIHAAAVVGALGVGVALLVGFVQSQPTAPTPFFSNDQAGLLKVLIVIVAPIIGTIGLFVWRLAHGKEQHDLNGLGERITALRSDVTTLGERVASIDVRLTEKIAAIDAKLGDDRLIYMSQVHQDSLVVNTQLADLREKLGRVDERVCTATELKEAIATAMTAGLRDVLREIKREGA